MRRTASSRCAPAMVRRCGIRPSVASATARSCTSWTGVNTSWWPVAACCTPGRSRKKHQPLADDLALSAPDRSSQQSSHLFGPTRALRQTMPGLLSSTKDEEIRTMAGALILAALVALGPRLDPGDSTVPRGVMSEAVAFHVRATDPRAQSWLRLGAAQSQTFRDLHTALAASDLIVHEQPVKRLATAGQTSFV